MEGDSDMEELDKVEVDLNLPKSNIANGLHHYRYDDNDDYDDGGNSDYEDHDSLWREKYRALSRELDTLKRKMADQNEEEISALMSQKRHSEKLLAEERTTVDDLQRQLANSKRKLTKSNSEMEDIRMTLDGSQSYNAELEKKQRRFDQELNILREQLNEEAIKEETFMKERSKLLSDKSKAQKEVQEQQDEIVQLKRKVGQLKLELEDDANKVDNDEMMRMKQMMKELESKMADQEDELDEQASHIEQLEQSKLRSEMSSKRDKEQFKMDIEAKDEEIERVRNDGSRKIHALEEQLQQETEAKNEALKGKKDLERRIYELQAAHEEVDKTAERKLRKELKKYKALYKDAKFAADTQVNTNTNSIELKSIKAKIQDAEFARQAVLKAKVQLESQLDELHSQLDTLKLAKEAADEKIIILTRENTELMSRGDEVEDEMEDVLRSNRMLITQMSKVQEDLLEHKSKIMHMEEERENMKDKINSLVNKLQTVQSNTVNRLEVEGIEMKIRELDARVENEVSMKTKAEHLCNRLRGQLDSAKEEKDEIEKNISKIQQNSSKFERMAKELKRELETMKRQEEEQKRKREALEIECQEAVEELNRKKTELSNSERRIRDLQDSLDRGFNDSSEEELDISDNDSSGGGSWRRRSYIRRSGSRTTGSRSPVSSGSHHSGTRTPGRRFSEFPSIQETSRRSARPFHSAKSFGGFTEFDLERHDSFTRQDTGVYSIDESESSLVQESISNADDGNDDVFLSKSSWDSKNMENGDKFDFPNVTGRILPTNGNESA